MRAREARTDEAADALDATTACKAADGRLGDALDVVPEHLAVALGAALSEPLASLSASGHCCCWWLVGGVKCSVCGLLAHCDGALPGLPPSSQMLINCDGDQLPRQESDYFH